MAEVRFFRKKLLSAFTALSLTASCFLCGCSPGMKTPSATDESMSSFSAETSRTEWTGESDTPPAEKPEIPIETPAGAVLVGFISKDGTGWYFTPEQPLGVKLTCFPDNPFFFEGTKRIGMYPDHEDGMNKSLYTEGIVTVYGSLQLGFDGETLFLVPYRIDHGRTAELSRAEPSLQRPEEPAVSFDRSVPLPSQMEVKTENGKYVYNPYLISTETLRAFGNSFADFYTDFVSAWLSYETSCPCPDKNFAEMLPTVLFYEFPLFTSDGKYSFSTAYDAENGVVHWSYTADKKEHEKLIKDFTASVNSLLSGVNDSMSDTQKAKAVYHALSCSMTYDYEALESRNKVEPYYAYTEKSGVCVTFACAYFQLLTQLGIESTLASASLNDGSGHVWNAVTLDGFDHFCDVTFELSRNNGTGFDFFGMTAERCLSYVDISADSINVGIYSSRQVSDMNFSDKPLVP